VVRGGRWGWVGWPLAVLGTVNTPGTVGGLAAAAAVVAWHRRRLRYGLAVLAAAGLILLENQLRWGNPLEGGYAGDHGFETLLPYSGRPGFSYPLFFGLLSALFAFGKGLVWFTPGLFLRYPRSPEPDREADLRLLYRVWVAVVVGLLLVYARWWAWYGGASWGPRFYLFACLPAALVLARLTDRAEGRTPRANLLALAAVALSCWAGANGMVFREYAQEPFAADNFAHEYLGWYVPECSVLWQPFVVPKEPDAYDRLRLLGFAAGFVYLAGPLAVTLGRQAWAAARGAWREGPGFRL
jgi:hypothetical protein